jgi:hypothetical protein
MFDDSCLKYARRTVAARWKMTASLLCFTAFLLVSGSLARAATIPLPRERPEIASGERSPAPDTALPPSPCQLRLAEFAVFEPSPPITGQCTATDVVKVDAVLSPDKRHVLFSPPAILRCPIAEAVAQWITNDVAPTIAALGTSLHSIENLESFGCRPRNGIAGAQISEHGHANALDVRSFKLTNGGIIELNNTSVVKSSRERIRDSACARFSTVLGNGADAYHDTHVHVDLMARSNHYKICQWDVLDPAEAAVLVTKKAAAAAHIRAEMREARDVPLPRVPLHSHGAPRNSLPAHAEEQAVTVGPWTVAVSYKGDKFENCSMNRSAAELGITFLRAQDGLLLVLDSQKWKLERGKA